MVARLSHVTLRYGESCALEDVSLAIAEGERVCVLGANGSGKSTLASVLAAILAPDEGEVTLVGEDVCGQDGPDYEAYRRARRELGLVFQNPDDQMVTSIVEEDVAFGPENLGLPPEEIGRRVSEELARVALSDFAKRDPSRLSGGQKQRVAIAGALALRPRMLVLDEPGALLDVRGRRGIMRVMGELAALGVTVVHVTHFMEEALAADRVIVLDRGRIVMEGSPEQVFSQEERLSRLGLEVPFVVRLAETLRAQGMAVPWTCDDSILRAALVGGPTALAGGPAAPAEGPVVPLRDTASSTAAPVTKVDVPVAPTLTPAAPVTKVDAPVSPTRYSAEQPGGPTSLTDETAGPSRAQAAIPHDSATSDGISISRTDVPVAPARYSAEQPSGPTSLTDETAGPSRAQAAIPHDSATSDGISISRTDVPIAPTRYSAEQPGGSASLTDSPAEPSATHVDPSTTPLLSFVERRGQAQDAGTLAAAIRVSDVSFSYGNGAREHAVDRVSFGVAPGRSVALIGQTGSGKSTLARLLCALEVPDAGSIVIDGIDTARRRERRQIHRHVGYVMQHPERQLFAETVYEDVSYGPRNLGLTTDEVDRRTRYALKLVGLRGHEEDSPFHLSGGQQRLCAIAGILAMEPKVLVLDEPTAGLDPKGRDQLSYLISDVRAQGTTIVTITHSMDAAARADQIVVLLDGRVLLEGRPRDVFAKHNEQILHDAGLGLPHPLRWARWIEQEGVPPLGDPLTLDELADGLAFRARQMGWQLADPGEGGHPLTLDELADGLAFRARQMGWQLVDPSEGGR